MKQIFGKEFGFLPKFCIIAVSAAGLSSCEQAFEVKELPSQNLVTETRLKLDAVGGAQRFTLPLRHELSKIPQDPKNPLTPEKVTLGKMLFFETGLAVNNILDQGHKTYSCSSCHNPNAGFTSGNFQGMAEGGIGLGEKGEGRIKDPRYKDHEVDALPFKTPSYINAAWFQTASWNGKFGSVGPNKGTEELWKEGTPSIFNRLGFHGLETQAIAGMDVHRMIDFGLFKDEETKKLNIENSKTSLIYTDIEYIDLFRKSFPTYGDDDQISQITTGLAVAAFGRTIIASYAPFQNFLRGDDEALTDAQLRGLQTFIGKGRCIACHSSAALNSDTYHALAVPDYKEEEAILPEDKTFSLGRGKFTKNENDNYKFKTPSIYNTRDQEFLSHGSHFRSVREIILYKSKGVPLNKDVPQENLSPILFGTPLDLTEDEIDDLTDFVENALYDETLRDYRPDYLNSGLCFPNNDYVTNFNKDCL